MERELPGDEYDDDTIPYSTLTPARIVQRRFIGLINAVYNYVKWLEEKDRARRDRNGR